MISNYRVGLIVAKSGLTEYQQSKLEEMMSGWIEYAEALQILIPGYSQNSPSGNLPAGLCAWLNALELEQESVTVNLGKLPNDSETQQVLSYLETCDELIGFPAKSRTLYRPDRVWSAYLAVTPPAKSRWRQGMKIIQP